MQKFKNKKILIAPFTKTSNAFKNELFKSNPEINFIGFIDKVQIGEDIYKKEEIRNLDFDFIFIISPNHFFSIYKEFKFLTSRKKLIKIEIENNSYKFLDNKEILKEQFKNVDLYLKEKLFFYGSRLLNLLNINRDKTVFISSSFIGGNNKFLFLYLQKKGRNSSLLTRNIEQYKEFKARGLNVIQQDSFKAYLYLVLAKNIVVDQGDNSKLLNIKSKKQKTMQLWHGVPLEHMNLLIDIEYDYFISTSDYVSNTSFNKVFLSNNFLSFGYPRNDVFLKEKHEKDDLIFTDEKVYELVKSKFGTDEKIVVYMPTFRESDFGKQSSQYTSMPLEYGKLNESLKKINTYMIIKLHPFVMVFFKDLIQSMSFSNVIFHNIQGDIYPILKYTDVLITDYSSVYADFLLLNRPIIFFLYDHGKCSKMAHGYLYEFDEVSPGEKAYNQDELIEAIKKVYDEDSFKVQREELCDKFFKYKDSNSSRRILEVLENE